MEVYLFVHIELPENFGSIQKMLVIEYPAGFMKS